MAGLIGDSEGGERASTTGGDHAFTAAGTDESHLDSFFAGSGWTREDVMLLLMVLQAALLLLWYATEVRD